MQLYGYMHACSYHMRTKFCGINFRALIGSEFRGSIFLCGVNFMDGTTSVLEQWNQLPATWLYKKCRVIKISTKWAGAFYFYHWATMYHGRKKRAQHLEPNSDTKKLLGYARKTYMDI